MFATAAVVHDPLSADDDENEEEIFESANIAGREEVHKDADLDDHGFWVVLPAEAQAVSTTEAELLEGDDEEPEGWSRGRRVAFAAASAVLVTALLLLLFTSGGDDSSVTAAPTTSRERATTSTQGSSTTQGGPTTTFVPVTVPIETLPATNPTAPPLPISPPRGRTVNVNLPPLPPSTDPPLPDFSFLTTTTTVPPPPTTVAPPTGGISVSGSPAQSTYPDGNWPQVVWWSSGATSVTVAGPGIPAGVSEQPNFQQAVCPNGWDGVSCNATPGTYDYTLTLTGPGGTVVYHASLTITAAPEPTTTTTIAP